MVKCTVAIFSGTANCKENNKWFVKNPNTKAATNHQQNFKSVSKMPFHYDFMMAQETLRHSANEALDFEDD